MIDSRYEPAATEVETFNVTVPDEAVLVSSVIPELDGFDRWVNVNVFPEFPPVVAIERLVAFPAEVATELEFDAEKRSGAATLIVTTFVTVAPVLSVAVKVSIYVYARTVAATFM